MSFEKRKQAIALSYDSNKENAPKVVAKGKGLIADKIIGKAKDNDVPVQEDPSLVELLSTLNINEQIPEDLYMAVAEVFAFIYSVEKEKAEN
ncbi:EscU/YscU/HrcU family type III secretion system export apparatus switch protein [Bacillus sp. B1-b2]|uniref:EscU/YscU/HrcU family type III secretion system export apparatus switch protein n=1 Tax=Bacillus sp. B1-b2 TaxID=2653201 RepID=UPI0012618B21|nr:EscU/YscU/HrcU family type III secretion system export apparatus switch protein [Bacillus sp. B1-b2]KAB7668625.1 EscU/YscU/HrcU family type III secretion system export apparatus switch protein [Bacillus sp. B1-b2]